jgi:uncharacterized protein (DUF488 family)
LASEQLHTLGYEKRTLEAFLAILREASIDVVVDVRDTPWSHKPGFSQKPLAAALAAADIRYLHARFAGNPKALRSRAGDEAEAIRLYTNHLARHPEILDQLDALLNPMLASGRRVCLICFERDPAHCHRGVLAAAWTARHGPAVLHLGNETSSD